MQRIDKLERERFKTDFQQVELEEAAGMPPLLVAGAEFQQQPRLESVDLGLAKLQEIRECVENIATDGAKFFDKGKAWQESGAFVFFFALFVCCRERM